MKQITIRRLIRSLSEIEKRHGDMPFKVRSRKDGRGYVNVDAEIDDTNKGEMVYCLVIDKI